MYNDIKRMLLEEKGLISQIVLTGTINRGGNLKHIVGKVLIQICAKIGGIPWVIDDLPLLNEPTMICGTKMMKSVSEVTVLGFVASMNSTISNYWSKSSILSSEFEYEKELEESLTTALQNFNSQNEIYPSQLIFYRDFSYENSPFKKANKEIQLIQETLSNNNV